MTAMASWSQASHTTTANSLSQKPSGNPRSNAAWIWAADGTVLYSDRTALIGAVYPLGDDELEVIEDGGTDAELSDLSRPENRYERSLGGDLLEVYTRVRSPEGQPLLFEAYFTADELSEQRSAAHAVGEKLLEVGIAHGEILRTDGGRRFSVPKRPSVPEGGEGDKECRWAAGRLSEHECEDFRGKVFPRLWV